MTLGTPYDPDEWKHGLRCSDCDRRFSEGMSYSKRLEAMHEDTAVTLIVCVGCALDG